MEVSSKTVSRFTARQIREQSGLSSDDLSKLNRAGLLRPEKSGESKFSKNFYSFQDLAVADHFARLLASGVQFEAIRSAYRKAMANSKDYVDHPSAIKLVKDANYFGENVLLAHNADLVDPETGEPVFDFTTKLEPKRIGTARVETLESLKTKQRINGDSENTHDWFEYALDCEDGLEFDEAQHAYENSIRCDSTNADAWVNLGRLHFANGRQLDSKHCYEEAIEIDEQHQVAHYNLGILFYIFDATQKAILHLTQANSIPEANQCLARIYRTLGDKKRAARFYRKFQALSEEDEI